MKPCKINMTNGDIFIVKNNEDSEEKFIEYVFGIYGREKRTVGLVLFEVNKYDDFESNIVLLNVNEISSIEFMVQ